MQNKEMSKDGEATKILTEMDIIAKTFINDFISSWANFSSNIEFFNFQHYCDRLKKCAPKTWSNASLTIAPRSKKCDHHCFLTLMSMV